MASRSTHTETDAKTPDAVKGKPNINNVTESEMKHMHISQITDSRVRDIIQYRDAHGPFESLDDVEKVPGYGPMLIEQIKTHFICE